MWRHYPCSLVSILKITYFSKYLLKILYGNKLDTSFIADYCKFFPAFEYSQQLEKTARKIKYLHTKHSLFCFSCYNRITVLSWTTVFPCLCIPSLLWPLEIWTCYLHLTLQLAQIRLKYFFFPSISFLPFLSYIHKKEELPGKHLACFAPFPRVWSSVLLTQSDFGGGGRRWAQAHYLNSGSWSNLQKHIWWFIIPVSTATFGG